MITQNKESLEELKLVVGDSFENIASLQDCHFQQRDSVQTLGETSSGVPLLGNNPQSVFI